MEEVKSCKDITFYSFFFESSDAFDLSCTVGHSIQILQII